MATQTGIDIPEKRKGRKYFVLLIALSILMTLATFVTLMHFVDVMFLMGNNWWMSVVAWLAIVFTGFVCCSDGFQNVLDNNPNGISTRVGTLRYWKKYLRYCVWVILGISLIAGTCCMVSSRYDGVVESFPIFAERDIYHLNSHGKLTTVSRARYVIVGVSYETAFTFLMLGFETFILYILFYNEPPIGHKEWGMWSNRKQTRGCVGPAASDNPRGKESNPATRE
jgi:hypothetical protein